MIEPFLITSFLILAGLLIAQIATILRGRRQHGGIVRSWQQLCHANEVAFERGLLALHERTAALGALTPVSEAPRVPVGEAAQHGH